MSLAALWQDERSGIHEKSTRQILGYAGPLLDDSTASAEFRDLLRIVEPEVLCRFAEECLADERFPDSGKALQDIVNEVGRRLGFQARNGFYQGRRNAVGCDGLWRDDDGYALVVEVKTTDVYSINLDTLAGYRAMLAAPGGEIRPEASSVLIVVGRVDTGGLEAQIRGSRHAWDMRLLSVEALLRLMMVKQDLDRPAAIQRARSILRPREFTRLDEIVDLVFRATEDVRASEEPEAPPEADVDEPGAETERRRPVNLRDACANRIARAWDLSLIRRSYAHFSTADDQLGLICLGSKTYEIGGVSSYWFAFHPHQREALRGHARSWLALGCGSKENLLVIPRFDIEAWLPRMWTTTRTDRSMYWHIKIYDRPEPTLSLARGHQGIPLGEFLFNENAMNPRHRLKV